MRTLYAESLGPQDHVHRVASLRYGRGQDTWLYRVIDHSQRYQRGSVAWMTEPPTSCLATAGSAGETGVLSSL